MSILQTPSFMRAAAALALVVASCSDAGAPGTGERITISAVDLGRAYADGEASAQRKYGNRRLRVSGVVTGSNIDSTENFVLRMKGPDPLVDVHLTVSDEARAQAKGVARGSEITLLCEGATEVLGSPTLDGCTFEIPANEDQAKSNAAG
ncbi:MAG TPA: hypothetical protein VF582_03555 [Allosphingosinicella sp.]